MLSLAPRLPSRLPWKTAYACYRALAQSPRLFAEAVDAAAAVASAHLPIADIDGFRHDARTTWLLETADLYLSRRQPVDWLPPHVAIQGTWPSGAFIALTFHYGTGLWLCRALRHAGHRSMFLSARFERSDFAQRPWRHAYGLQRLREVERLGGEPIAYRPGVRQTLLDALQRGSSVIGLVDIPPRLAPHGQVGVRLLDQKASLPDGLLRLAAEARVPIVPCWVDIDFSSGHRTVVIGEAQSPGPVDAVLTQLATELDRLIRKQPAAWMFWPEWDGWIRGAASL
ncbi:MAG: hypothetical protein ABIN56_16120 [Dokdonella sp.]